MPTELPDCPWQRVASDICDMSGTQYLVTIDYFSRYLEVQHLSPLSSAAIVKAIHTLYASHGYPEVHVTDNGPQFAGETFQQFRRNCSVHHWTSSPKYSQGNGRQNRPQCRPKTPVGINNKPPGRIAQLPYYATSQRILLYGRKVRNLLPAAPDTLNPAWPALDKFRQSQSQSKSDQQQRHGLREKFKRNVYACQPARPDVLDTCDFPSIFKSQFFGKANSRRECTKTRHTKACNMNRNEMEVHVN